MFNAKVFSRANHVRWAGVALSIGLLLSAVLSGPVQAQATPDCTITYTAQAVCKTDGYVAVNWTAHASQLSRVNSVNASWGQNSGPYNLLAPGFSVSQTFNTGLTTLTAGKLTFKAQYWNGSGWTNFVDQQIAVNAIACTPTAVTLRTFRAAPQSTWWLRVLGW